MNVLVVGGGGREHAICQKLAQSPKVTELYCAPGNGGIAQVARCVPIKADDVEVMVAWAASHGIDFAVVAPDDPLALGMVDAMEAAGVPAFGPRANAAVIESSKVFSKGLMEKYHIPTARYAVFTELDAALAYVEEQGAPIVVKADGLALGKGVVVAQSVEEAKAAVRSMMEDRKFGAAGARVVIEECMTGPEVTVLAFCDGEHLVPMPSSQDHKRAYDGNQGPNTGGMGAISPSPNYTPEVAARCMEEIFLPTVAALKAEGRPFQGVLYFGLMLTQSGPKVVEYNARFGDPECQAVLSLLESDLL
ncbi:MAG TPA: phosphoribosylamine--glycine ligase, partial [Candidatus Galloscillospira excrementavium]|nr:phosphoribosylamine--glycine ligase [Candidatus Galloscillospira excrementavium]